LPLMQTMSQNGVGIVGVPATSAEVGPVEQQQVDDEVTTMHLNDEQLLPIPPKYADLAARMGEAGVRLRLMTEAERTSVISARERRLPRLANGGWKRLALRYGLAITGLYARGYRNYLDVQVTHHDIALAHLPPAFDGFRILHLSDLHIDLDPALIPVVHAIIAQEEYDIAVMTGDFRSAVIGSSTEMVADLLPLVKAIKTPAYAVLGNHDFLEIVPPLEGAGVRFLMNETVPLTRGGQSISLSGVDDGALYATDDVPRAAATLVPGTVSLLLSHTPDLYLTAAAHGYDLMLSGHTHAGQICLPGGRVLQRNAYAPDHMLSGAWRYRNLRGYTSSGVGATGVPIRFSCPPEAVVHTLRRG
jgi:predicted MPP superfamily phosphohydrolase